jgi:GNAT superfamily N-acetyltransferase
MAKCAVTVQEEALSACLDEVLAHTKAHWEETQREHDTMPLDLDLDAYAFMEAQGKLVLVTVRVDDVLVGYCTSFLYQHLKSRHVLCAVMDAYYLAPSYRGLGLATQLFAHVQHVLHGRGVQRLFGDTKAWHDLGAMFERHGWQYVGKQYTKWIGD